MRRPALAAIALLAALPAALPAQSIRNLTQASKIRKLWEPIVAAANRSVVEVCVDERAMVLGTVVGKDLVVTKLSEITVDKDGDAPVLSIDQGDQSWPCQQIGVDRPTDLALLRVTPTTGASLTPVRWKQQAELVPGAFLASVDGSDAPFGVGVLAAAAYVHTVPRAFLGIRFANPTGGEAAIDEAVEHGAAAAAGIRSGDVVVRFGDEEIEDTDALRSAIRARQPGDKVKVTVRRGEDEVIVDVVLGTNSSPMRSDQESVWGELSEVRSGFQRVLQHDTVLKPEDCGGPIVDLSGAVVGVNVARAGRIETLALPAEDVQAVVARLLAANKKAQEAGAKR
ncbi:MAG: PDZ domain-containing protein [Planctomycetota bacterium]|nr:PDZ domain-containing protein [Planctomycetota bacterium]